MSTSTAVVAAPVRTHEQRLEALRRGNWVRSQRAEFKQELKAGRASVASLMADPPEWAASMKAIDLLVAAPGVGRVKANRTLYRAGVSPTKTLTGLTERQRRALLLGLPAAFRADGVGVSNSIGEGA